MVSHKSKGSTVQGNCQGSFMNYKNETFYKKKNKNKINMYLLLNLKEKKKKISFNFKLKHQIS